LSPGNKVMTGAYSIKIRGVVQGVGFRPFVYRLASAHGLKGWVLNGEDGVAVHLEGEEEALRSFLDEMNARPPKTAAIEEVCVEPAGVAGFVDFTIRQSNGEEQPTVRISPDLPVCNDCLRELVDPLDRRHHYPYINCTNCGPRYSVIRGLPYDRSNTTMADWALDEFCAAEYHDPANRRFHAQPVACPACGPQHYFRAGDEVVRGDEESVRATVNYLRSGKIVAVKGLGGYHLACDAKNGEAVSVLRTRKFRKEKPFALMAKNLEVARGLVELTAEAESLMTSVARPIVLAPAKVEFTGVSPENDELGVMLPYTPLHHLLFAAGAPEILVMTSANRSSEPIAYQDEDAAGKLAGIADGFLIGERPIARRVDDSVARAGVFGPAVLRRARGYAPGAVAAKLPAGRPILAVGADLKNTITLVVDGQAFVSQHIGDLDHYECLRAFQETIRDLLAMYEIDTRDLLVVHDAHPQYVSTLHALTLAAAEHCAVQHHRAHIASVLAERGVWDQHVIGVSFDGTGYGDDGTIWGGEIFSGSIREGFERATHLRGAALPGGDAAASHPVQAAAGFLAQLNDLPDMTAPPFSFPSRYLDALKLVNTKVRCFDTSSIGRLFDTAAALLGFTRETTFEGQAAMWLERLAKRASETPGYPFPFAGDELDFRPVLQGIIRDRICGRDITEIARAFQRGISEGLHAAITTLARDQDIDTVVLCGGVFQNELLLHDLKSLLEPECLRIWTNNVVPANDGGISLGQAALTAFAKPRTRVERAQKIQEETHA
jgi:hydrogenase maturation protein HypF